MSDPPQHKKSFGVGWTTTIILFAILLVFLSQLALWKSVSNDVFEMSITAGSRSGLRHQIAETLQGIAMSNGLDLQVVPTDGSIAGLQKVETGEIQFGLVQGGLAKHSYKNIRQVAVLHIEPLHLLVRFSGQKELPDHWTIESVTDRIDPQKRIRINISRPNSGTHAIASDLLQFFDLSEKQNFETTELSYQELMSSEISTAELPEMVFTVSSLPSPVARHLIHKHGYRPMRLNVANAYRLDWTAQKETQFQKVIRRKVVPATIPAYSYQVNPPVPKIDVKTIGTRLHLIANDATPPRAVEKMIAAIYQSSFAATSDPPLAVELLRTSSEFELHQGASSYLEKKTPVITEKLVEVTEQILAIAGTIFGAVLFAWQALSFVRRRRRDRQFLQCVSRVGEIEHRAMEFETKDEMKVDDLVHLQQELNEIKSDMIQQFQKGDIDGADTLSGFLMHINDANENLTRMILHERKPRPV